MLNIINRAITIPKDEIDILADADDNIDTTSVKAYFHLCDFICDLSASKKDSRPQVSPKRYFNK